MNLSGLISLLRALKVSALDQLKLQGLGALKAALRAALSTQRVKILNKAVKRLVNDGTDKDMLEIGPFYDKDGMPMTGKEYFVHEALYAIARAARLPGVPADILRDDHFVSWGFIEAPSLVVHTDVMANLDAVMERLIQQMT